MITTKVKKAASKKSPSSEQAFRRLSMLLDIPLERLEPKICRRVQPPRYNLYRHEVTIFPNINFAKNHELIHSINYMLLVSQAGLALKQGNAAEARQILSAINSNHPFFSLFSKTEFYAESQTSKILGGGSISLFAGIPEIYVVSQLMFSIPAKITNLLQYVSEHPVFVIASALAVLVAAGASLLARHFRSECCKYGIDGYLAAMMNLIHPMKIRSGLRELEKRGILQEGVGFTDKGKMEVAKLKGEVLDFTSGPEKYRDAIDDAI